MKITVLGCGRWGSFHAWYANYLGNEVTLYGRENSKHMANLMKTRQNEYLTLPQNINLTQNLTNAINFADVIIISISAQQLRTFVREINKLNINLNTKKFLLCMKGMESGSGKRLSTVFNEELDGIKAAVWVGPGHVQDFLQGIPNCMVISSSDDNLTHELVNIFKSSLISAVQNRYAVFIPAVIY